MAKLKKRTGTVFDIHNVETIIIDDNETQLVHLRHLSIREVAWLASIVFKNDYDLLIRREVEDEQ